MSVNEIHGLHSISSKGISEKALQSGTGSQQTQFGALLQSKANESLNFSRHAAKRLDERGISVDSCMMSRLEQAVADARKKGARDVAVIGQEGVFIINVPNNVVITTMTQEDMKERVFTNIDSAVIV